MVLRIILAQSRLTNIFNSSGTQDTKQVESSLDQSVNSQVQAVDYYEGARTGLPTNVCIENIGEYINLVPKT